MKQQDQFSLFTGRWLLFWWLLIALISTTGLYYQRGQTIGWWAILPVKLAVWFFWSLYAVLIFRLARWVKLGVSNWWKPIMFHLFFSLLSVLINVLFYAALVVALDLGGMRALGLQAVFLLLLPALFEWYFIIYWAIVIFTYAFDLYHKYQEKELQALQLEKRLILAQLQTLKMQLHPHFLFNTLNTIAAQVRLEQQSTAIRMLSGLSELLRTSLNQRNQQVVPLEEEIHFVRQYLDLEQARFGPRLALHFQIDPAAERVPVPAFLLQPLVENAVYHGLAKKLDARKLDLRAELHSGRLQLELFNEGPSLPAGFDPAYYAGIGLSNTLERLSQFYGEDFEFKVENRQSGVQVSLSLPLQIPDYG